MRLAVRLSEQSTSRILSNVPQTGAIATKAKTERLTQPYTMGNALEHEARSGSSMSKAGL